MAYRHISVAPIAGALGAEIDGVNLAEPLAEPVLEEIHRAFLEHQVIILRNQDLTPEAQKRFANHFGSLHINDFFPTVEGHPDMQLVAKNPTDSRNVGDAWHTDVSYVRQPPLGSILYAKTVPPYGGDTQFASMYSAHDTLSDGMKSLLSGLNAVHSAAENFGVRATGAEMKDKNKAMAFTYSEDAEQEAVHPVVTTHPETGRKVLYVNSSFTKRFENMTEAESAPLLGFLFRHLSRPEMTCRVRWQQGTLVFWDNRCTQHYALNDYHGHTRLMHRVTVLNDRVLERLNAAD